MAKFVGIELDELRINSLQTKDLQLIRDKFSAPYNYMSLFPVGKRHTEAIFKHLANFVMARSLEGRSQDELALELRNVLPDYCVAVVSNRDDLYIALFKQALQDKVYTNSIAKQKRLLDFASLQKSITRQNLRVAYANLQYIIKLNQNLDIKASQAYKQMLFSAQIVNYIDILLFMYAQGLEYRLDQFYSAVELSLEMAIKNLNEELTIKPKQQSLLFSNFSIGDVSEAMRTVISNMPRVLL